MSLSRDSAMDHSHIDVTGEAVQSSELRFIDFISSADRNRQMLAEMEAAMGLRIVSLAPPPDQSGPKLDEAVAEFSRGAADFGRI